MPITLSITKGLSLIVHEKEALLDELVTYKNEKEESVVTRINKSPSLQAILFTIQESV
jgi:hypothetical protein